MAKTTVGDTKHNPTMVITNVGIESGSATTGSMAPTTIERIAVKMPTFSKEDTEFYFLAGWGYSFALSNATHTMTKFYHAVTAIPLEVLRDVTDIIRNPPDKPYTTVKGKLLSIYADSEEQRIRRVLQDLALGDRKPSMQYQSFQSGGNTLWL